MKKARHLQRQYTRLKARLARLSFQQLSERKKDQLRRRLMCCEQQLYRFASTAALATLGTTALQAQIYCDNAINPFDGIDVGNSSTPQPIDVDGDGDLDLISGERFGTIQYYQNDGSDNYIQQTGSDNPFDGIDVGYFSTPQLIDVDSDGDLDLISGASDGTVQYYQNDGSGNYTQQTGSDNPFDAIDVGAVSTPQLIDMDGDGDLDLISGEFYGMIQYYQNDGSDNFTQQTGSDNPFDGINVGSYSNPQLIDVDGDGDLDLISGAYAGTIQYYQNNGSGNYNQQTGSDNPFDGIDVGQSSTPQLIDVDSDGDLDLISGAYDGTIRYYENRPTCLPASVEGYVDCASNPFDGIDVGYNSKPQLIDVDGDGDLDLISGETSGTILYYQNDGSGNYTEQMGSDNPFDAIGVGNRSTPQLIDVDGDGDLDLISGENFGTILYYQNDGSGNYTQQTGSDNPFDAIDVGYNSKPQLIDVDVDGDLDLISGEFYGTILYYQNDGSGNYTQQTGSDNPFDAIDVGSRSTPRLIDVDVDGDLDLISGEGDGTIQYYQNDGSGNYNQQTGSDNPFDGIDVGRNSSPQLIDVDGDGDLDLITGERYGTILYYQNVELSVSAEAATAACGSSGAEVDLTVESDLEGPYTISNAFSGSIGMAGMTGAMETLLTDITEAGIYVFEVTAADGCVQVAALVDIEAVSEVDINTLSIDLLCEGVAPGTCPPIAIDFEEPEEGEIVKYQARITVLSTGETFERMVLPPPLTVRPFLPPRIVGEEVSIEIAPILEGGTICAFSEPRTFVVDCEDTDPLIQVEDRSEQPVSASRSLDLLLQPNPVSEAFDLTIVHAADSSVQVSINDLNGRAVLNKQFDLSSPQHTERIEVAHLPAGVYFVTANVGGKDFVVRQLVKL